MNLEIVLKDSTYILCIYLIYIFIDNRLIMLYIYIYVQMCKYTKIYTHTEVFAKNFWKAIMYRSSREVD